VPAPLDLLPWLIPGAVVTIGITVGAVTLSVPVAFAAGLMRLSSARLIRWLAITYVEIFRGTSVLVQLFVFFYVLPIAGITLDPVMTAIVVLALNAGSYGSEVVRSAVLAVDKGQRDAAIALNMKKWLALRRIIIPQAIPMMLPSFGNLAIQTLKDTALASVITIPELAQRGRVLVTQTHRIEEVFGLVLVLYFVLALPLTELVKYLERRSTRGMRAGRGRA
jgi:polar amino acid transport system permease protein